MRSIIRMPLALMLQRMLAHFKVRPRLLIAIGVGVGAGWLLPEALTGAGRVLVAWNAAVWLYLILLGTMMAQPDHGRLRRQAAAHAESAVVVLVLAAAAAVASLAAIFVELGQVRSTGAGLDWPQLALTLATVVGAWLLLPFEFALTYASRFYSRAAPAGGLEFPRPAEHEAPPPNYIEFLYFSFTVAATAQTSDVGVTSRAMRRLVIAHSVLSFAFNTLVLALAINMVASLF
jgi:uncharacterized membrane protein